MSGAISGVYAGVIGAVNAIIHPLDNVLYPILDLHYDASIISAAHIDPTVSNPYMADLNEIFK
jgi:hypothetical protein